MKGLRLSYAGLLLLCWIAWACAGQAEAWAQEGIFDAPDQEVTGQGWRGFTDLRFLWHAVLALSLATALGAALAYHPRSRRTTDTLEEAEAPKTYLLYAVVGLMVLEFGLVVGFVVFGIGGLIRFRTDLPSATKTGRLILVTLIGLSSGLNLPHPAVLTTAFGFLLIYVLDARITYRIEVKGLEEKHVAEAAETYRRLLEEEGCRILSEKKSFAKAQVAFIFQASHRTKRKDLEHVFERHVPQTVRGAVDWEAD